MTMTLRNPDPKIYRPGDYFFLEMENLDTIKVGWADSLQSAKAAVCGSMYLRYGKTKEEFKQSCFEDFAFNDPEFYADLDAQTYLDDDWFFETMESHGFYYGQVQENGDLVTL